MSAFRLQGHRDPGFILEALRDNAHLWNQHGLRRLKGSPHEQVRDIWLRFNDLAEFERTGNIDLVMDGLQIVDYPAADVLRFPMNSNMARVLITALPPGASIAPHVDEGYYAQCVDRYHWVLQAAGEFRCGSERLRMCEREIWWFDSQQEHSVLNDVESERIHLIMDVWKDPLPDKEGE